MINIIPSIATLDDRLIGPSPRKYIIIISWESNYTSAGKHVNK